MTVQQSDSEMTNQIIQAEVGVITSGSVVPIFTVKTVWPHFVPYRE